MKKIISVFFLLLITITSFTLYSFKPYRKGFAETLNESDATCESYYLLQPNTSEVILSYNEDKKLPIASMCKIMTLLLAFEQESNGNLNFNDTIIVSENASNMGGSQVFLRSNEEYLISDLIKSIVVASANDASVAIAEKIAGNEQEFVNLMNKKCIELGMDNTVFVNCTGLPRPGQFSCAKDVAIMFSELIKYSKYFDYSNVWMDKIYHNDGKFTEISNTNKLIKHYKGCIAGKTGYTNEAGHCVTVLANRNDMDLIAVVIKGQNSKARFKKCADLLNFGFDNYKLKKVVDSTQPISNKGLVVGGMDKTIDLYPEKDFFVLLKNNEQKAYEFEYVLSTIKAPVVKNQQVGYLSIFEKGKEVSNINILAGKDVSTKGYIRNLVDVVENWV
ncbi:MAG: D-alanyl-D-alanine carboxypeptidase [Clostridia bacterium]|nr:D-alanyl-D-alanine carboxypeptidase [Clostridia bacterium]